MKYAFGLSLACVAAAFALLTIPVAGAAPKAAGEATLATRGAPLFSDDFARSDMAPKWRVGKGAFSVSDGVVTAAENPDDHHPAYAYVKPGFAYKDIIADFSVKLDGAHSVSLMVNDSKYKGSHAGHIFKASVSPGKVNLSDWKLGAMKNEIFEKNKDPNTTPQEKKKLRESIKDTSATFKTSVDFSQWHTVRVAIVGDEALMSIDGKPAAYLKSEGIDHPTKNALGFEIGGKSASIKDVKVWAASANPDWASHREAVVNSLEK